MHLRVINVMELIDDYILENISERQLLLVKLAAYKDELELEAIYEINRQGRVLFKEYKHLMRLRAETTPRMATAFCSPGHPALC